MRSCPPSFMVISPVPDQMPARAWNGPVAASAVRCCACAGKTISESPNATAVRAQEYVRSPRAALTAKDDAALIGSDLVNMAFHLCGCPERIAANSPRWGDKTGSTLE